MARKETDLTFTFGGMTKEEAKNFIVKEKKENPENPEDNGLGGFSCIEYKHMKAFVKEYAIEDKDDFINNAMYEKDKETGEIVKPYTDKDGNKKAVKKYRHGQAKSWFFEKYGLRTGKTRRSDIEDDIEKGW